ncbi:MAG: DUF2807 domain-containing protein [Prevotellaceae bacterium]|jgi:phage shock protein PspC (stress-responsive transcriptional regulator)|nr:DUF2807 domain-containing protein [Prevotellaceae bacterium]
MKRTLTVNLSNQVFHIDEDAYDVLKKYLSDISQRFKSNDSKDEIMSDIESRIAELFTERLQKNKNVVTIEDVNQIMKVMGNPQQFRDDNDNEYDTSEKSATTGNGSEKKKRIKGKRFYRDPSNAILGGVASGLSAFLGVDVTLIRIILVILIIFGVGFIIPIYIAAWIISPQALTASQRLEMQGEDVTIENIKTELNNAKNYVRSEDFRNTAKSAGQKAGAIVKVLLKILIGFIGTIFGFIGIIIVGVLFFVLFLTLLEPSQLIENIPQWNLLTAEQLFVYIVSLLLIIGCPLFVLIYGALRIVSKKKTRSTPVFWIALVLWIIGFVLFYGANAKTLSDLRDRGADLTTFFSTEDAGEVVDQARDLTAYHSIDVGSNIKIELTQEDEQKLSINAGENILPKIITEVKDSVLYLYTGRGVYHHKINAKISTPDLRNLDLSGASSAKTTSAFILPALKIAQTGVSQLDIEAALSGNCTVDISGASTATLSGSASTLHATVSGASALNADNFTVNQVDVSVNGGSHAGVYATERANLEASGAGNIICKGHPPIKTQNAGGVSSIRIE